MTEPGAPLAAVPGLRARLMADPRGTLAALHLVVPAATADAGRMNDADLELVAGGGELLGQLLLGPATVSRKPVPSRR